jgi:hypothetical protein
MVPSLWFLGRWDEALKIGLPLMSGQLDIDAVYTATFVASIAAARGNEAILRQAVSLAVQTRDSTYVDLRVSAANILARDALEREAMDEALGLAREVLSGQSISGEQIETAFGLSIEVAIALGDETAITELEAFVAGRTRARATPLLRAGRARLQAELAYRRGDVDACWRFEEEAIRLLLPVGARPLLAQTLAERGRRHGDADALAQARSIYEELGAIRWLERIESGSEVAA